MRLGFTHVNDDQKINTKISIPLDVGLRVAVFDVYGLLI
jgi:hypothetical protein